MAQRSLIIIGAGMGGLASGIYGRVNGSDKGRARNDGCEDRYASRVEQQETRRINFADLQYIYFGSVGFHFVLQNLRLTTDKGDKADEE